MIGMTSMNHHDYKPYQLACNPELIMLTKYPWTWHSHMTQPLHLPTASVSQPQELRQQLAELLREQMALANEAERGAMALASR